MAAIRAGTNVPQRHLRTWHLVGRDERCDTEIVSRVISRQHAVLVWTTGEWHIKDLGSANGTVVNGQPIEPKVLYRLCRGTQIELGSSEHTWEVVSISPPTAFAVELATQRSLEADQDILCWAEAPDLAIYRDRRDLWIFDNGEGTRAVEDRERISIRGRLWEVHLPECDDGTTRLSDGPSLSTIQLIFTQVCGGDMIAIVAVNGQVSIPLGQREHHHLLYLLAQRQAADVGMTAEQRGWVRKNELIRMMFGRTAGPHDQRLDTFVYRARQQFASAGIHGAPEIIERKRGWLRLGVSEVEFQ